MALSPGDRLGPYTITAPIGAGGMGEVYKASDTRLGRTVAIKVLPAHLANDPDQRHRLQREARMVAGLSHPHICALFDIGDEDGVFFLVLEYLEGETLAKRLKRGALSLEETLRYGAQIADALDSAHQRGLVHRDLKPANVILTSTGAKLLDFGLAKPVLTAVGPDDATMSADLTAANSIAGTLQYMAPEQLEGKPASPRSDIFALGAVLYEMASGRRALEAGTPAATVAAIVGGSDQALAGVGSPALEEIIRACLIRDPGLRWQSARDLYWELGWISSARAQHERSATTSRPRAVGIAIGVVGILAALAAGSLMSRQVPGRTPVSRFLLYPPENAAFRSLALSPDGRNLAFTATRGAGPALWIRPLDSVTPRLIAGTEGAYNPFWSPDGRFVAFFALGALKKVDVAGASGNASPETLYTGDTHPFARGAWNRNNVILFSPSAERALLQVPATGGGVLPVTTLNRSRQETLHTLPAFLPDGRRFLFIAESIAAENRGIYAGSLDGADVQRVLGGNSSFAYVRSGGSDFLLLPGGGALAAHPFDLHNRAIAGEPHVLADRVGEFSASETGVLAYLDAVESAPRISWLDRRGVAQEVIPAATGIKDVSLSANGRRAAVVLMTKPTSAAGDLWLVDLVRASKLRFTFRADVVHGCPVWSPDGNTLVYSSNASGQHNLYSKPTNGVSEEAQLLLTETGSCPTSWSSDGRFLVYQQYGAHGGFNLWVLPMSGERKPIALLKTRFSERQGQISPDRRWIAYTSDESGEREIYVQPFTVADSGASSMGQGKWKISNGGGHSSRWSGDGKELYYIANDRKLMSVSVHARAAIFDHTPAKPLFELNPWATSANFVYRYDVSTVGDRFLAGDVVERISSGPMTVLLNWPAAARK